MMRQDVIPSDSKKDHGVMVETEVDSGGGDGGVDNDDENYDDDRS